MEIMEVLEILEQLLMEVAEEEVLQLLEELELPQMVLMEAREDKMLMLQDLDNIMLPEVEVVLGMEPQELVELEEVVMER
jgi:hypothetical protein